MLLLVKKYLFFISIFLAVNYSPIYATEFGKLITVYLQNNNTSKISTNQMLFLNTNKDILLIRHHKLTLSIAKNIEFGINIPYINQIGNKKNINSLGGVGDIYLHLNIGTNWFQKYITLNWYLEFNTGTGIRYKDPISSPIANYGFQEWKTGILGCIHFTFLSFNWNVFYIFNSENENYLFNSFFNGQTLNIFSTEAYKRLLGLNPFHSSSFFYYKNFSNDVVEINLGVSSKIFYPFILFIELHSNLPFNNYNLSTNFYIARNNISIGFNVLLINEKMKITIKNSIAINLNYISDIGIEVHF